MSETLDTRIGESERAFPSIAVMRELYEAAFPFARDDVIGPDARDRLQRAITAAQQEVLDCLLGNPRQPAGESEARTRTIAQD